MKYPTLLGAICALALVLAACAPAAATESPATLEPTTAATEPPATESPAATEPPVATDTSAATDTPSVAETATVGVPVTGEATVNVADVGTYGSALVDGEGRSLYLFTKDTQNSGASTCSGDCLAKWPALTSQGSPVAGEGVDATLLGTITRDDGTMQVTYNGWPLYYYAQDTAAGDANGQGVGDVWYLVSPAGEAIQ